MRMGAADLLQELQRTASRTRTISTAGVRSRNTSGVKTQTPLGLSESSSPHTPISGLMSRAPATPHMPKRGQHGQAAEVPPTTSQKISTTDGPVAEPPTTPRTATVTTSALPTQTPQKKSATDEPVAKPPTKPTTATVNASAIPPQTPQKATMTAAQEWMKEEAEFLKKNADKTKTPRMAARVRRYH